MVKTSEIIFSLVEEFKKLFSNVDNWEVEHVSQGKKRPAFFFYVSYDKRKRASYNTTQCKVIVEAIYLGEKNANGLVDYKEKYKAVDLAREFLDTYVLEVGDRTLKFDYEVGQSSDNPRFTIYFNFLDSVINHKQEKEQSRDLINHIKIDRS